MADRQSKVRRRGRPAYPGFFTPAEQRVLEGLRRGLTYQQIADELQLSYDTVKYHVSNMLSKAEVDTREQLVEFARQPGLRWGALPVSVAWIVGATATAVAVAVAVAAFVLAGTSRNGGGLADADDTPTVAVSPAAGPSPTPGVPVSGVPIVDEFITAALSGDMTNLEPLIHYQSITCTGEEPQGIGGVPCPPGVPAGSPVRGILAGGGCHGGVILEADMPAFLSDWDLGFNAVFSASDLTQTGSDVVPPVWYTVILTFTRFSDGTPTRDPLPGIEFSLTPEGITGWSGWCGETARGLSTRHTTYLIPPPPLPQAPPDTPHTGNIAVDEIVDAIVVRDLLKLQERTKTVEAGCGEERWLPRCYLGGPIGTLVPAVVREICGERTWAEPWGLGEDYDSRLGPNPRIVAIARGEDSDGVAYWVVFDGSLAPQQPDGGRAMGVTEAGEIAVINGGCNQSAEELAGTFREFVVPPR
ncbi:MAG TPA: LuxR C-terminal-related transcriptional regulator [Tepidiformaceae bacterium]|nr:LuxR C-terminal-related transcriptional regulator [Tepidiformaceae bacterium]